MARYILICDLNTLFTVDFNVHLNVLVEVEFSIFVLIELAEQ